MFCDIAKCNNLCYVCPVLAVCCSSSEEMRTNTLMLFVLHNQREKNKSYEIFKKKLTIVCSKNITRYSYRHGGSKGDSVEVKEIIPWKQHWMLMKNIN